MPDALDASYCVCGALKLCLAHLTLFPKNAFCKMYAAKHLEKMDNLNSDAIPIEGEAEQVEKCWLKINGKNLKFRLASSMSNFLLLRSIVFQIAWSNLVPISFKKGYSWCQK